MVRPPSYAVIGANYGDEGKGLITDFLAREFKPDYVIRFNGGAQAGHTVTTADGKRHVFKHVGAGSLAGIPTILSEHFISNPILLNTELAMLDGAVEANLLVDDRSLLTTPFDMLVNQTVERLRGGAKHGSCGVGINETVTRSEKSTFCLRVHDLLDMDTLRQKLELIREMYIPYRIKSFGFNDDEISGLMTDLRNPVFVDGFITECERFLQNVQLLDGIGKLRKLGCVVFEGAQGLALDEHSKDFPHVTRSRTGMANVASLARQLGIEDIRPIYVTRAYMTRHGAGPLKNELHWEKGTPHQRPKKPYRLIDDQTNIDNEHQGSLRFAYLDIDAVIERVHDDVMQAKQLLGGTLGRDMKPGIAVTCLDQVEGAACIYHEGQAKTVWKQDLPFLLKHNLGFEWSLASDGPSADDVRRGT